MPTRPPPPHENIGDSDAIPPTTRETPINMKNRAKSGREINGF